MTCLMGGEEADRAANKLKAYGIPNYFDPARAIPSLETLADYRDVTEHEYEQPAEFNVEKDRAREVLSEAVEREVDHLSVEAMDLLDAYGVPTPAGELAESAAEAEAIACDLGGPVVMKIVSPDILHKFDLGGVEVGVSIENVRDTYHDSQFGHLLMFGLGGIFVQIFEDTSFRIAPVSEREARAMTAEIQATPMLRGARGRTPADVNTVMETIQQVSQLVTDFPAIRNSTSIPTTL